MRHECASWSGGESRDAVQLCKTSRRYQKPCISCFLRRVSSSAAAKETPASSSPLSADPTGHQRLHPLVTFLTFQGKGISAQTSHLDLLCHRAAEIKEQLVVDVCGRRVLM